jgi:glycosyltransferase involved in cell wall biosynthesis
MRIAVYQQHLEQMGGGERYALDAARHLRRLGHDVDVVGPVGVPLDAVGERLGIDVSGLGLVHVPSGDAGELMASEVSAGYDTFVNCTHMSRAVNRSPRSVYVSHFPSPPRLGRPLGAAVAPEGDGRLAHAQVSASAGVTADPSRGWWTDGHGWLDVRRAGHADWSLRLWVGARHRAWRGGDGDLEVRLDGQVLRRVRVPRVGVRRVTIPLPMAPVHGEHHVELVSGAGHPALAPHPLGVWVRSAGLRARGATDAGATGHLRTYERVVATSDYAAGWVRRWWKADADVVHPPVRPPPTPADAGPRRSIVVVGRFFTGGHSKRQLELVEAFGRMCRAGLRGWRLHVVGGVEAPTGERYVELVRRAARDLPVEVEVDVTREHLGRRLAEAAVLWQATGWGEDPQRHPERFEHFGISCVEGMALGAVPVALGVGGVREIVRDGVDGVLWTGGPERDTLALLADAERLARMSTAARERARDFAAAPFEAGLERALAREAGPR